MTTITRSYITRLLIELTKVDTVVIENGLTGTYNYGEAIQRWQAHMTR